MTSSGQPTKEPVAYSKKPESSDEGHPSLRPQMEREGLVFEGRSLEEAVRKGLQSLDLSRAEVQITMLEEGSGGFLGMGARPYRVRIVPRSQNPNESSRAENESLRAENESLRAENKALRASIDTLSPHPPQFLDFLDTDPSRAIREFYTYARKLLRDHPPAALARLAQDDLQEVISDTILHCCQNDFRVLRTYKDKGRSFAGWLSLVASNRVRIGARAVGPASAEQSRELEVDHPTLKSDTIAPTLLTRFSSTLTVDVSETKLADLRSRRKALSRRRRLLSESHRSDISTTMAIAVARSRTTRLDLDELVGLFDRIQMVAKQDPILHARLLQKLENGDLTDAKDELERFRSPGSINQ